MSAPVTCSLCGFRFDPEGRSACPSCPLNPSCQLVCCPNCGASDMAVDRSSWVLKIKRLFGEHRNDPILSERSGN